MLKRLLIFLLAAAIHLPCAAQEYSIPDGTKRIVFIGNSITYSGQFVNYVDTYLTLRYPDRGYEIINLGLPSETVSGLSEPNHADGKFPRPDLRERLQRVLAQVKPDLVIANYGMNDGIYLPFHDERFEAFQVGMNWMHQAVENSGAGIIHVTPPLFDERKGAAYSNVLDIYSDWLISRRYTEVWKVIDLHWPMRKSLEDRRAADPDFVFAKDGVHPDAGGHFLMAKVILVGLGESEAGKAESVEALLAPFPNGMQILSLIEQRQEILKNAWLTQTGHLRPGLKEGLSLQDAEEKVAEINQEIEKLLD
ncbi:hypothetical protein GCM10009119_14710 [Algoriphagus jejuensis]|uniref:SGNH hydrolase-type esterase domain-containing protein n=1 Tax=Algoriphagus jejuensis TaxID=419934 RepID=A0ABP3YAH8_9BACT